jgi:hypothetical protein
LLYLLGNCFEGFVVSLLEFFIESRASITLSLCWGVSVFVFLNFSGLYFLLKKLFCRISRVVLFFFFSVDCVVPPLLSLFSTCPCADDGLIWVGFS